MDIGWAWLEWAFSFRLLPLLSSAEQKPAIFLCFQVTHSSQSVSEWGGILKDTAHSRVLSLTK